ncbi:MAG: hypothetical protein E7157_00245 [Lactobacillales bacterium]|nr:hypothetical protein [Lactobacillales bacterium]
MEKVSTQKILFYNGTYVKDRKYGLVNDYLTYEENPKRDYNVYLDLDSDNIYHVDVSDEEQFEQENIVIKIPVVATNCHEYMYNYMKVQTWYNNEKETKTKEEIIEKIKSNPSYKYKKLFKACHKYPQKELKAQ